MSLRYRAMGYHVDSGLEAASRSDREAYEIEYGEWQEPED